MDWVALPKIEVRTLGDDELSSPVLEAQNPTFELHNISLLVRPLANKRLGFLFISFMLI